MQAIIDQVKAMSEVVDEKARRQLTDGIRDLLYVVETPGDLVQRLIYGQFQLAVASIAQNTKLTEILVKRERQCVSTELLAESTGIEPRLTERILRFMAAMGMVSQISDDDFAANKKTEALNLPGIRKDIGLGMDIISPSAQALPAFLKQTGYKNLDSIQPCAWHPGHDEEQNVLQYLSSNPTMLEESNRLMASQRLSSPTWLDAYPVEFSASPSGIYFVDIGGGVGHMCTALKERIGDVPGRVILQDVPQMISSLSTGQCFEPMIHNFFMEQPIKGAKYYYLRNIMHGLNDASCQKVLTQTKAALAADSMLVDDIIMPKQGAHWRTVHLDLSMMAALGAMVRTKEEWEALVESVGLKITSIHTYDEVQGDSLLEIMLI